MALKTLWKCITQLYFLLVKVKHHIKDCERCGSIASKWLRR